MTLVRCEKAIFSPFALCFELRFRAALTRLPPFGEIVCTRLRVLFPFRLERLIISLDLFVLFCSFSTQKTFLLFDCQRSCALFRVLVGLDGLEPSTSRLSGARSSHLSYKPRIFTQRLYDSTISLRSCPLASLSLRPVTNRFFHASFLEPKPRHSRWWR